MRKLVAIGLGIPLLILAYWAAPKVLRPFAITAQTACTSNLEALKRVKQEWAAKTGKPADATPTEEDLFGRSWTNRMPVCPAGAGVYRIGKLSENPTCSLGGPAHSVRAIK